jgi:hypothetical protein
MKNKGKGILQQMAENEVKEGNKFSLQDLKNAFEYMDKEPVPEVTDKDIEVKFLTDEGYVKGTVWINKNDWDFQVAYRKHKAMEPLTEEELKLLNLNDNEK